MNKQNVSTFQKNWFRLRSLRFWMIFVFGGVPALVVICISLVKLFGIPLLGLEGDLQSYKQREMARLGLVADLEKHILQSWLRERIGDLRIIANDIDAQKKAHHFVRVFYEVDDLQDIVTSPEFTYFERRFKNLQRYYPSVGEVQLADAMSGEIIVSSNRKNIGTSVKHISEFKSFVDSQDETEINFTDLSDNERMMTIWQAVPLMNGGSAAVLISQISIDAVLMPLLHSGKGLGSSGEVLLVDDSQRILTPLKYPIPGLSGSLVNNYRIDALPARLASTGKEGILYSQDYRGVPVLTAFRSVNIAVGCNWGMVLKQDISELRAPLYRQMILSGGIWIASTLIVLSCCILFARILTNPLKKVTKAALRLSKGNFNTVIPRVKGYREVEDLSEAFGYMANFLIEWDATLNREIQLKTQQLSTELSERNRLMAAIEQTDDAIILTDHNGNIEYVNPAFESVSGYDLNEVLGQSPRFLKSGKQDDSFYREMWESISNGKKWSGRIVNKHKDGHLFIEDATISPVKDSFGKIVNFVAVKRDVTVHIKAAEEKANLENQLQQAQKMESVGRLAGGVAHDYNNALTSIMGFTELAMMDADPKGPLHADLSQILKAGKRATDITKQLLAFARKQTIAPVVLDLNRSVESMLKMLRRLIGEDIDLVWMPGKDLGNVKMDPSQIDQILANLCVNARDAIEGVGKITIETATKVFDSDYCADHTGFVPGEFVMLTISDNGCGMDKEILKNIFEPFFTTKPVDKGTGLGLSTVYGIVKQNNGFINVYSEPGKGTGIKIYLPPHEDKAVEIQGKSTEEVPQGRGETILVVEDDQPILKLAQKILEGLNYTVFIADTPKGAISLAKEHTGEIHLLVTDVIMPEMNGRELSEQLQSLSPDLKCIFMSGYTANAIAHHGVLDEGVHFIQKPFSKRDLATIVRKVLDGGKS